MPNHITNIVTVIASSKHERESVFINLLNGQGEMDFNKFIPISPELLRHDAGNAWYSWCVSNWGTKWNAYNQAFSYERLAFAPWHRSYRGNWLTGSKLRAYVKRINKKRYKAALKEKSVPIQVEFDTAWSMPHPVFLAISQQFPNVQFEVAYADEDTGFNCGLIIYKDGVVLSSDTAGSSRSMSVDEKRRWRKFAFNITHPHDNPRDYGYDENWDYVEE